MALAGPRLKAAAFLADCALVDLEVAGQGRIFHMGAVRGNRTFERKGHFSTGAALRDLDRFCRGARFILGHNLLGHDLPVIARHSPESALLALPVIDTLYLSALAFPENPYHRLVKDYKLVSGSRNNPVADARLAGSIFKDQWERFSRLVEKDPDVPAFFRFCFDGAALVSPGGGQGMADVFAHMGAEERMSPERAATVFIRQTEGLVCANQRHRILEKNLTRIHGRPALAYCLAWLRVAGGNSVTPPWVRHRFDGLTTILGQLRDNPCDDDTCAYCVENHNPRAQLRKYFGYDDFRELPDGTPLQREIAAEGMRDRPLLGILPTGFGKSICFQLPGFVRYHRRGLLTVVISPLQALMKDQVDNLKRTLNTNAVEAVNGLLTLPERGAILEQIRLGDIGILYISPEQLRNRSVTKALSYREIGCWVFDEAHCISKWGHDFRPDYLYAARFIREFSKKDGSRSPVACYTATAKRDVVKEIARHFKNELGQELTLFLGGIERDNLHFEVQTVNSHEKYAAVNALLEERIGKPAMGSTVVYCATRDRTEELSDFLCRQGWTARAFHAGMKPPEKRSTQEAFVKGEVPVICATSAFGMGIDKDNVRLVVHADIPGSLENYLQEAGRAGRDTRDADCVLLYDESDIETQFRLGALSKLDHRDIVQILRGLRKSRRGNRQEVIITAGELLRKEDVDTSFESDAYGADTKVRAAVAWLERAGYLERDENRTSVFQGKPKLTSPAALQAKLDALNLPAEKRLLWAAVYDCLSGCDPDEGLNADQIAEMLGSVSGIDGAAISDTRKIIHILHQMTQQGLLKSGMFMSAYIRPKGNNNARQVLNTVCGMDRAMIRILREEYPLETVGEWVSLDLRRLNQRLIDADHPEANTQTVRTLLTSLARDGKGFAERQGSIELRHSYQDQYRVKLQRSWEEIDKVANRRRNLAVVLLNAIYERIPSAQRGQAEMLVEFTSDDMLDAIRRDMSISVADNKQLAAMDRGLLFLHEQKAIILQKGLAVFRQAMTIRLNPESRLRRYSKGDYEPLAQHYRQGVFQVHVMNEYARLGMEKIGQALAIVTAYFTMDNKKFVQRFFPDRKKMLAMATSAASYGDIVESLKNPQQEAIVCSPLNKNILILAGPGSGKTRVVIHRCAYLLRVERVPEKSVLVLCFNHSAALAVRRRLWRLIGSDARDVTILTYHALAMRLTGRSFADREDRIRGDDALTKQFDAIIADAIALLEGRKEIVGLAPDDIRDRLLAGYQHILVDEYQDIDEDQYRLISALTGRTLKEPDRKMSILAVGDDDQSIYGFRNANVKFIRRFREDYMAEVFHLVENYRSTKAIIDVANALIQHNTVRMKTEHPIRINRARWDDSSGGVWKKKDPLSRGRVQVFSVKTIAEQAAAMVRAIRELQKADPDIDPAKIAVFSRNGLSYPPLASVRHAFETNGIPFSYTLDRASSFSPARIREFASFFDCLGAIKDKPRTATQLMDLYHTHRRQRQTHWDRELLRHLAAWKAESGDAELFARAAVDFIHESLADQKREQRLGHGVYLTTVHGAKGLEFDHVFVLDGGWRHQSGTADQEEERRLFYVAMTRARETLSLFRCRDTRHPHLTLIVSEHMVERRLSILPETCAPHVGQQAAVLGMKHLFMDFAGRQPANAPVHEHIRHLTCGDELTLTDSAGDLHLVDNTGVAVARLSNHARGLWWDRRSIIEKITVIGVVRRYLKDVQAEYRPRIRCDQWEIPIVEILFRNVKKGGGGD